MVVLKVMESMQTLYHRNDLLQGRTRQIFKQNQTDTWSQEIFKELPKKLGAEKTLHLHVHELKEALASAKLQPLRVMTRRVK